MPKPILEIADDEHDETFEPKLCRTRHKRDVFSGVLKGRRQLVCLVLFVEYKPGSVTIKSDNGSKFNACVSTSAI